jgi:hypothetical protein
VLTKKDLLVPSKEVPENLEDGYYYPQNQPDAQASDSPGSVQEGHPLPADKVPKEKGGPLTPMSVTTTQSRVTKVHLFRTDGRSAGCGWLPKTGQVQTVSEEDWLQDTKSVECAKCFKYFTWPSSWMITGQPIMTSVESDSSAESDAGSASEVDSDVDSDDEAIVAVW